MWLSGHDQIRQVAREFSEQQMEEEKLAKGVEQLEGYGADTVTAEGRSLDRSDRLFLDENPEDRRKPKYLQENHSGLSACSLVYIHVIYLILEILVLQ